jgi:glycosyltransferase involved in cell wall biosynthesis
MPDKEKTLVLLTPAFPADESDSVWVPFVQLFVKNLSENFPAIPITVLSFKYPHHTKTYQWNGVKVISFDGMYAKKLTRVRIWLRVWKQLKKIKKEQTIIGLFSFWCGDCALVGHYFGKKHGIKHFCWIAGMDAKKENKLIKLIRPRADELVAMSSFLIEEFYKNHSVKPAHLIPIGIDTSEYSRYEGPKDIDILGVGSLVTGKQYDIFIHVVKQVSLAFPNVKAIICGSGSEQELLVKLVKELRLENNITLTGAIPHNQVLQYMQRTKIFLHPSAYEGFGLVYLEALYAGAHTIGFTYPITQTVTHWHRVKSNEEMVMKAISILQNPEADYKPVLLYSMEESVRAIMKLFEIEQIADKRVSAATSLSEKNYAGK